MEVLVSMGGFTQMSRVLGKLSVQERGGVITAWILCGELNVWVKGIKLLKELLAVCHLLDDRSVIHLSNQARANWGQC